MTDNVELRMDIHVREALVDLLLNVVVKQLSQEDRTGLANFIDEAVMVPAPPFPKEIPDHLKLGMLQKADDLYAQYFGEVAAKIRAMDDAPTLGQEPT